MDRTQVIIIGGGATGAGILWDLSLRGIHAVLLEKRDLANGATGRCHGLLHSGARYVVKDAEAARECLSENQIIKTIAPHCVHDVGGLFVRYPQDDPAFFAQWDEACAKVGMPTSRLNATETLELEPNLPKDVLGASTCPDALFRGNVHRTGGRQGHWRPLQGQPYRRGRRNRLRDDRQCRRRLGPADRLDGRAGRAGALR